MRQRNAARQSRWLPGSTKLTDQQRATIVDLWRGRRATQQQLARMYGVTQSLVHEVVKRSGLTRTNAPAEDRTCDECGTSFQVTGHRKLTKKSFCSKACYWKHLYNPDYQRSVYGTRLSREKVRKVFNLGEFNVVHHVDFDNGNTALDNLWVFATQEEHMRYHRGGDAAPIWKGSEYVKRKKTSQI